MKTLSRALIASLAVSAAWLLAGNVALAVPPLPHARIDNVSREQEGRTEMIYVLPEWARAELAGPLSVSENGRGYFARSVSGLKETYDSGAFERGIRGHERVAKKSKKVAPPKSKRGGPGSVDPPGRGKGYENQPILPEPLERAFHKKTGSGTPTPPEIPEPSSSSLLAIALVGWLAVTRPVKPR
jgi:hypothetical protein